MLERERKYRITRRQADRLHQQLARIGYQQHAGTDRDRFFDHPLLPLERAGRRLRLRHRGTSGLAELTFKGPQAIAGRDKLRRELTVRVSARVIEVFLHGLGFTVIRTFAKWRWAYKVNRVEVSLDHLAQIGWFCELEALGPDVDLDESAAALNLEPAQIELRSYADIVDDHRATPPGKGRPGAD